MRAIDTNVLVRLITQDDPQQVAAAQNFIREGAWVSVLALTEALWVLGAVYRFPPRQVLDAAEMLLRQPQVVFEHADAVRDAVRRFRDRPSLGFTDCMVLELARKAGHLPLGTFDRRLGKENGAQKI